MTMTKAKVVETLVHKLVSVNLVGQGIADGQKVLIAAVQLLLVTHEEANHISQEYCLNLGW